MTPNWLNEYMQSYQTIVQLMQDKEALEAQGLAEDAARVAKQITDLQGRMEMAKLKIDDAQYRQESRQEHQERMVGLKSGEEREKIRLKRDLTYEEQLQEDAAARQRVRTLARSVGPSLHKGPDAPEVARVIKVLSSDEDLRRVGSESIAAKILRVSSRLNEEKVENVYQKVAVKTLAPYEVIKTAEDAEKIRQEIREDLKKGGSGLLPITMAEENAKLALLENKKAEAQLATESAEYTKLRQRGLSPAAARTFAPKMADPKMAGTPMLADEIKGVMRSAGLKKFGYGAGATLLAGLLAKKIFGGAGEQVNQLSPDIQMALAARLQEAQGGEDGAKATSRTLSDIGKLLSIIKVLQGVGGAEAQLPVSAGSIV